MRTYVMMSFPSATDTQATVDRARRQRARRWTHIALAGACGFLTPPAGSPAGAAIGEGPASQAKCLAPAGAPLRVVIAGSRPFVVTSSAGEVSGLSVDVWKALESLLCRKSTPTTAHSVAEALATVAGGKADVAVGPISITSTRAERVAFTHPYFEADLAILAPASRSLLDRIRPFLTRAFLAGACFLVGVLILVGAAVWLAERRDNPEQFPSRFFAGIGNGVWMALVTMTTVGYGDRVPRTTTGRVLVGFWMTFSMIFASSLTAFIASALTLSQIEGPTIARIDDLRGRRVGVVGQTTSQVFVDQNGGRYVAADDLDAAIASLLRGDTEAVVFDRPMLRDYLKRHPERRLRLSETSYEPQSYGFAVRPGDSAIRRSLDVAILRLRESGRLDHIIESRLGP
ncbi:MAG: transporter substrate-binding domain-containing protein [Vicinamibacteria bacterium]|nr:transporter substrate-binding domain-containing protein [Vicinamibacteria bacterium]